MSDLSPVPARATLAQASRPNITTSAEYPARVDTALPAMSTDPIRTPAEPVVEIPQTCTDRWAMLDAALLREGRLSPEGVVRFSRHAAQCDTCKLLLAIIVDEAQQVERTGEQ